MEREWYDETDIILNGLLDAYAQAAKRYGEVYPLHEDEEEGVRIECCEQIINVCVFDDEITDKQDAKMRELSSAFAGRRYLLSCGFVVDVAWCITLVLLILDKGMRSR